MGSSPSRSSRELSIKEAFVDSLPIEQLRGEPERINPAIVLAEKLMRREPERLLTVEEVQEAEAILAVGTQEIETVELHRRAFLKTPASAVYYVPVGF